MTDEQIDLLHQHWLLDNPQIEQVAKEHFENPIYSEMEASLETDPRKILMGKDYYIKKTTEVNIKTIKINKTKG